jgi:FG-GAP-like repeat
LGNGSFASSPILDASQLCGLPIDFNGDGRADCLFADSNPVNQKLTLSYGAQSVGPLAQFSLTSSGQNLYAVDGNSRQTVGVLVEDLDGDGRQDIMRWSTDGNHQIYFSNGDGSFRPPVPLGATAFPSLINADGTATFVTGDFLGNGTLQFLNLKQVGTGAHQLLVRGGGAVPVDVLSMVTSPNGLATVVQERQLLTREGGSTTRYISDRGIPGLAGQSPIVDLQPPIHVITQLKAQTGVGELTTHFAYRGLKADRGGRGLLGFREMWQQSPAPNGGAVTQVTEYLQRHPYDGAVASTKTYPQALITSPPGQPLTKPATAMGSTVNTYCEASIASPDASAPCYTQARVVRPYLQRSVAEGSDLDGSPLPKVTSVNTFNLFGDATQIEITTEANFAGALRTYSKKTVNTYLAPDTANSPNKISGNNWIIGRLSASSVESKVPNLLAVLPASKGSSPTADAVIGSPPPGSPPLVNPAAIQAILQLLLED